MLGGGWGGAEQQSLGVFIVPLPKRIWKHQLMDLGMSARDRQAQGLITSLTLPIRDFPGLLPGLPGH